MYLIYARIYIILIIIDHCDQYSGNVYQHFLHSRFSSNFTFVLTGNISPLPHLRMTFMRPLRELRRLPFSLSFSPLSVSIPFGFSLRLLRLFHSALPPPSRGNSGATLAVDINKHLDYTVKAGSTTSPD